MKLLIFNDDYADEHNVPAITVMTEEEYNTWLKLPSGDLNPDYEKELAIYKANKEISRNFWGHLRNEGITNTSLIPKHRTDLLELLKDYRANYKYISMPAKVRSYMNAYLGNSGECFEEGYSDYYLMEEFVAAGLVKVFDVSEEFAKTFNEHNLSSLSMCNVFEIEDE